MNRFSPLIPIGLLLIPAGACHGQEESPTAPERVTIVEGGSQHARLRALFPDALQPGQKELVIEITPAPEGSIREGASDPRVQALAAIRKFPKTGIQYTGRKDESTTTSNAITKGGGNLVDLKLIALAPGDAGTTVKERPTLWWFQSGKSEHAELEFILTDMTAPNEEPMEIKLKAMPAGFNSINLGARWLDDSGISLQAGRQYQWTIKRRSDVEAGNVSVFAKLERVPDQALEAQVASNPFGPEAITALSKAGNWYELFDAVAKLARYHPDEASVAQARKALLDDAKLSKHLP